MRPRKRSGALETSNCVGKVHYIGLRDDGIVLHGSDIFPNLILFFER